MDKLYRLTKARELQGRTTRVDTLRVDLQRGQAMLRLTNSVERLRTAQQELAELTGASLDTEFELAEIPRLEYGEEGVDSLMAVAFSNRLDYAQALDDVNDRERQVAIARRRLLPDLVLVGRVGRTGEGDSLSEAMSLDEDSWFAGIALESDLNTSADRAMLAIRQSDRTASGTSLRVTELAIARDVQQRASDCRRAGSELQIAERNVKLARGRVELARRLFDLGRADNFSVTDAEQAFVEAENGMLAAGSEASLAVYRLLHALGTLTEIPGELRAEGIPN